MADARLTIDNYVVTSYGGGNNREYGSPGLEKSSPVWELVS